MEDHEATHTLVANELSDTTLEDVFGGASPGMPPIKFPVKTIVRLRNGKLRCPECKKRGSPEVVPTGKIWHVYHHAEKDGQYGYTYTLHCALPECDNFHLDGTDKIITYYENTFDETALELA